MLSGVMMTNVQADALINLAQTIISLLIQ